MKINLERRILERMSLEDLFEIYDKQISYSQDQRNEVTIRLVQLEIKRKLKTREK